MHSVSNDSSNGTIRRLSTCRSAEVTGGASAPRLPLTRWRAYEMAIVLGTLLSEHRWDLVNAEPVVPKRRNLTMGPSSIVAIRKV